jgi:serine/threonine protein kinase
MLTTDLGACEWFVWDLRRSNLIDRGQLDQVIGEFLSKNPGAEPPALADYLVQQGILTQFQADRLLQGKTQGFVLGPFTLMDALGTGSMGTVYKAHSKNDNNWYAVKVLPRRSMWNVRIARRKVRLFEQCQHPTVVPFVDVGTAGGMHYLAWPLVEGETLEKMVQQQGKLNSPHAIRYAVQIAEGLEICHQQGIFHGLLKPSNLMIGDNGQVRILDYGIGCLLAETEGESLVDTMSTANSVNSGLDCASPESIMDPTNLTPVGDQYSLGCLLYFCLTGQYPFPDGTAVEKMMAHQTKQPTPITDLEPDIPSELVTLVERLMQKEPRDRYASCRDVLDILRRLSGGGGGPAARKLRPSLTHIKLPKVDVTGEAAEPPAAIPHSSTSPQRPRGPFPSARPAGPGGGGHASPMGGGHPGPGGGHYGPAGGGRPAPASPRGRNPIPPGLSPVDEPVPHPGHGAYRDEALTQEDAWVHAPPGAHPHYPPGYGYPSEKQSLGQRLGTTGVILLAFLAGALAWLLSSLLKF